MRIGSLFSGIGGLELGLERAGVGHTVWQVEQDEYCRAVLAKHWPDAQRYDDVRTVSAQNLAPVDVICGGFPCQDISYAGRGAGLAGRRSGLWSEFARVIREMGPPYVVVENSAALLTRGIGDVLGTLADLGYDAEWSLESACAVGAPHMRHRVFVLAYANGRGLQASRGQRAVDDERVCPRSPRAGHLQAATVASGSERGSHWISEPNIPRMDHGISSRVDRNRALGNAVVPQVAEVVGRVLLQIHEEIKAQ
jgi:DNA (cytosine-5)-methyltransferase 1